MMRTKLTACIVTLIVAVAFMPAPAFAASKVKMKTYNEVIKSKNTVYCAGSAGIYKAKVKKGKVKSCRLIYRGPRPVSGSGYVDGMKKKDKYLYFRQMPVSSGEYQLYRITTSGKHKKWLANTGWYAIKKKKLYTTEYKEDPTGMRDFFVCYYKMNLNGTKKKKTKTKVVMRDVASNAKGYHVITKVVNGWNYDYLVTPKGKFLLGKVQQAK